MDSSSGASPSYIPPSTAPDSARLQRGLAALAKQDYRAAIALLTAALDENPSAAAARRARVGLVKAHQRLGEFSEAIAYCQPLLQVSHAPTRDWSRRALVALKKAIARQPPSDVNSRSVDSHDTRSSASSANAPGLADDPSPAEIETGFVPLSGADTEPADAPVADRASRPAEGLANSPTNQPSSTVPSVAISVSADAQAVDAQTVDAQTVDAQTEDAQTVEAQTEEARTASKQAAAKP
ncbi:MAG: tetratricopeptide repeat protein, partial [Elainellaceae cyanobacterium]